MNALYFATFPLPRPRGWSQPFTVGLYWRAALIVFFNYDLDTGTRIVNRDPRHSVGGVTNRHDAHRDPLAFKAIMSLPQPVTFKALLRGIDGECPCVRRRF